MHLNLSADDVLSTTRAVRKRLDLQRPVARELILECLDLAVQAPSGSNSQGWHWIFVEDDAAKKALADIYAENFAIYRQLGAANPMSSDDPRAAQQARVISSAEYLTENFHRVPVLLVPCITGDLDRLPSFAAASMWGSILPAVWSFMLAARERGLGTAWTTIHLMNGGDTKAAEILGIPPGVTQAGLFPIANTLGTDFRPADRLPLEPITHWNRW